MVRLSRFLLERMMDAHATPLGDGYDAKEKICSEI